MKRFLSIILLLIPVFCWTDDFIGWKQIETEHYRFIFEGKDENTAQELASHGEEIYGLVSDFFQSYPKKVNVYINGRIDTPNGFFYPIPGSINLYPVYPLSSTNSTKSESWLYELLLHEMVHYISLENRKGIFGSLSYIFGKDLSAANGAFLPSWMIEGIAVYLESKFTRGGRGKNYYFEAINKAAAFEENYNNIYQLAYSSDFPPVNRIYSGGYALIKYILENFGEDIFQKIYLRYVKFPFFGPFYSIKKETGKNIRTIYDEFKASEIQKYQSSHTIHNFYNSIPLSAQSIGNWTHPIPTERGTLIYRTGQNKKGAIVLFNEENGKEEIIVETDLLENSSFSSDFSGRKIVFSKGDYSLYHSFGYEINSRVYLFENNSVRLVTEETSLFHPALSADGESLIAVKRDGSYSKLVEIDMITGKVFTIFERLNTNIMNPAFSPDGSKITFVLNDHGYQDIYIMARKSESDALPLFTVDLASEYYPRFINNDRVSFISDRAGDLSLYTYDIQDNILKLQFKDPVGVLDGYIYEGSVYYTSYRTSGYVFRKGIIGKTIETQYLSEKKVLTSSIAHPLPSRNYIDWTLPYLWLPKPEMNMSTTMGLQLGIGAIVYAGSYGQSGEWIFDFNVTPGLEQLNGSFTYSQKLGTTTFSYSFLQSYKELYDGTNYFWRQSTSNTATLSIPLFEQTLFNWRDVFKSYFSFKHKLQITEADTFSFTKSFSSASDNYLYGGIGLSYNGFKTNYSRKSLFGDLSVFNQVDFSILLPLLSSPVTSFLLKDTGVLSIPLGPEGFIVQTGWQAGYHNLSYSSSAVSARGWSPSLISSDISLLYSLDYFIPIALVDWGLPLGFNIQNLAATIHFEGISNFTFSGVYSSELFAGIEFIGTYGFNYGSIPAGVGLNFRVYKPGSAFIPAEDIRVYFFFSFNSLY